MLFDKRDLLSHSRAPVDTSILSMVDRRQKDDRKRRVMVGYKVFSLSQPYQYLRYALQMQVVSTCSLHLPAYAGRAGKSEGEFRRCILG